MSYLNSQNQYYEGDKISLADLDVPRRPSANHIWVSGDWAVDRAKFEADAKRKADEQIAVAIPVIAQVRGDLFTPGAPEYVTMTNIIAQLRRFVAGANTVPGFSESTDADDAFKKLWAGYTLIVATAPLAAKVEYSEAVKQLRRAGVAI